MVRVVVVQGPFIGRVWDKQGCGGGVEHDVVDEFLVVRIALIFDVRNFTELCQGLTEAQYQRRLSRWFQLPAVVAFLRGCVQNNLEVAFPSVSATHRWGTDGTWTSAVRFQQEALPSSTVELRIRVPPA